MNWQLSLVLGCLLLSVACDQPAAPDGVGAEIPVQRLTSTAFSLEQNSGYSRPEQLVIRDAYAWRQAWETIYRRHGELPPFREVDFVTNTIVLVAQGARPSLSNHIVVTGASRSVDGVTVRVEQRQCSAGLTAQAQSVDVAIIPRLTGLIQFEETVINCK
jgi:hypothetical protein